MASALRALAGSGLLIASTILTSTVQTQAAEPIHLRVADSFPKGHYLVKLVLEPWMEEAKKRTNNAVAFDHYPAQQLGKASDMLKLTQTGVADIGYVAPGYTSDKMPVSEVAMLPGAFDHSCQGTLAYWKLARNGVIAQQDQAGIGPSAQNSETVVRLARNPAHRRCILCHGRDYMSRPAP